MSQTCDLCVLYQTGSTANEAFLLARSVIYVHIYICMLFGLAKAA